MKKALISFFVLALIGINAFSYEYLVYQDDNATGNAYKIRIMTDVLNNGKLIVKSTRSDNSILVQDNDNVFYNVLNEIKLNHVHYISNSEFEHIYKTNMKLLNDLYIYRSNPFYNYLYNDTSFGQSIHVDYNNVKLAYDKNGNIVASNYNGEWAGLYDNNSIKQSGNLYNSKGQLSYMNGKDVSGVGGFFDFSSITTGIQQGVSCLSWGCAACFIAIVMVGALLKYIRWQNGLYKEGIQEDKKLMREIRTEANVLAFRTITGIDQEKTPDSVWTMYMKDDQDLNPLDRERKRQYVDVMQKNYEKWKNKVL